MRKPAVLKFHIKKKKKQSIKFRKKKIKNGIIPKPISKSNLKYPAL